MDSDENGATAAVEKDMFTKISVPGDGSCLFWAVTVAYLHPVRNNERLFRERFQKLFGLENVNKAFYIQKVLLNEPLSLVYNDSLLIELVVTVFRNNVVDEMMKQEVELFQSVTLHNFVNMRNESYITDGTFCKEFRSTFPSATNVVDFSILKPDKLNDKTIDALNEELDKVSNNDNTIQKFKFKSYLSAMRNSKSWAGQLEILAIQSLLQIQICVFNSKNSSLCLSFNANSICLFNSEIHYEFGLIKASFVIEALRNQKHHLAATYTDLGIDQVNFQTENGDSLLHFAALSDNRNDLISKLILQGADLHLRNNQNKSPLDVAIDSKLENAIDIFNSYTKHLIRKAQSSKFIDKFSVDGHSDLHVAAKDGNEGIVKLLPFTSEQHSSSLLLNTPTNDNNRQTAPLLAVINNHLNVNVKDFSISLNNSYWTPLHYAAQKGHLDTVKILIENGEANVDFRDHCNSTPLQIAVKFGHIKVVKYLVGKGADVNSKDKTLTSVLSCAARAGCGHITQYLIENGVNINSVDRDGMTSLHHAVQCGYWNVVQCLVEHKIDLNIRDNNNNTALSGVLKLEKWGMVRYLLENGALLTNVSEKIKNDFIKRFISEGNIKVQFYEAIKLGNVELVQMILINHEDKSEELISEMLAKAYDELKFSNVKLHQNMRIYIENKLLNFRFYSVNKVKDKLNSEKNTSLINVKARLSLVVNCIDQLNTFPEDYKVENEFLFTGKFIAQNLHILKRQLPSTYDVLPWEEIQFCLLTFISCYTHRMEVELTLELIMHKTRLLSHLKLFRNKLEELEQNLSEENVKNIKKIVRDKAVENILQITPGLKELYADFEILRDVYSLKRIEKYIRIACAVDLETKPVIGPLVIERALQVIGECLKNTPDSPNMSQNTQNMLIKHAPFNVQQIVTSLRDSLSHVDALAHLQVEENNEDIITFFIKMQDDLKKLRTEIVLIFVDKKMQAIKIFLERILECENIDQVRVVASGIENQIKESVIIGDCCEVRDNNFDKIKRTAKDCSDFMRLKSDFQIQCFQKFDKFIMQGKSRIKRIRGKHIEVLQRLRRIAKDNKSSTMVAIKNESRSLILLLSSVTYSQCDSVYQSIVNCILELYWSSVPNHGNSNFIDLFQKLFNLVEFEVRRIKSVETLNFGLEKEKNAVNAKTYYDDILVKIENKISLFINEIPNEKTRTLFTKEYEKKRNVYNATYASLDDYLEGPKAGRKVNRKTDSFEILVKKMLKEAMKVFMQNDFIEFINSFEAKKKLSPEFINSHKKLFFDGAVYLKSLETIEHIFNEAKSDIDRVNLLETKDDARVAIEMLMLTLTEILDQLSLLETDRLFIDQLTPLLIGKNLRNYLAHGDLLMDVLSIDHLKSIISHYNILKVNCNKDKIYSKNELIGKVTIEDISKLKQGFKYKLKLFKKQNELFEAAATSSDENACKQLIENGVEINVRNFNDWTLLYFSLVNDNVELFKFLLNNNLNIYQKDAFGNSVLNYLPRFDCFKMLQFLISKFSIDLDANLGLNYTLLHLAAKYGRNTFIERLIANDVDLDVTDAEDGYTPLQLAVENGHLDTVLTLLNAGADLRIKTKYGETLLHNASRAGFSSIVQPLIDNGLSVNDADNSNRTSLHLACLYTHENVVAILLENKANVNAITEAGEMSLYMAVQQDCERVVHLLLANGANIHAVDNSGNTVLHAVAYSGCLSMAHLLISKDADLEVINNDQLTALHSASLMGHHAVVEILLYNGAKIDNMAHDGQTALHMAARNDGKKVVKALIAYEADVNIKMKNGKTALHVATEKGYIKIMKILLDNGANINAVTCKGSTPLLFVVANNEMMLRDRGADIFIKNKNGYSPFYAAIMFGHLKIVETLLPYYDKGKDCESYLGKSPLHLAAERGHTHIVKTLIKNKADVNQKRLTDDNCTPLHLAAQNGHDITVTQLLRSGADVNVVYGLYSITALYIAVQCDHAFVVETLLKHGARVDASDINQHTPLHVAVSKGREHIVSILCKNKANVDAKDIDKWTPIHHAARMGFDNCISTLFSYGAKIDELTVCGWSAMHVASRGGHSNVVKLLMTFDKSANLFNQIGLEGESPLHLAAQHAHLLTVQLLIENGGNINYSDAQGRTALHYATYEGHAAIVTFLCNVGASVNIKMNDGTTPLHLAAQNDKIEIAKILIEKGAEVNATKNDNATPLHMATLKICDDLIKLLLNNETRSDATVEGGDTPLHLAGQNGHLDSVKQLLAFNPNLNPEDVNNIDSPLQMAVELGYFDITEMLIKHGADVLARDRHDSVFHQAVRNVDILKMVLAEIRNKCAGDAEGLRTVMNAPDTEGDTPLMWAAELGNLSATKVLLDCDEIDINKQNLNGWTALHWAARGSYQDVAQLLIANKADTNIKDKDGKTAFDV